MPLFQQTEYCTCKVTYIKTTRAANIEEAKRIFDEGGGEDLIYEIGDNVGNIDTQIQQIED